MKIIIMEQYHYYCLDCPPRNNYNLTYMMENFSENQTFDNYQQDNIESRNNYNTSHQKT